MDARRYTNEIAERLYIREKALSSLADSLKKHESKSAELKALKLFLARTVPEFKKQFPEIQRKLK